MSDDARRWSPQQRDTANQSLILNPVFDEIISSRSIHGAFVSQDNVADGIGMPALSATGGNRYKTMSEKKELVGGMWIGFGMFRDSPVFRLFGSGQFQTLR
jgi:hypothetical protein